MAESMPFPSPPGNVYSENGTGRPAWLLPVPAPCQGWSPPEPTASEYFCSDVKYALLPSAIFFMIGAVIAAAGGYILVTGSSAAAIAGGGLLVGGLLVALAAIVVSGAVRGVFGVALYHYVAENQTIGPFSTADLEDAVKVKPA